MLTFEYDNISFCTGGFTEFADFVFSESSSLHQKKIIVHINLRNFYYLNRDSNLKKELKRYCLTVFDGIGLKIGLWLKGYGLLPDLNGTDLFPLFMDKINEKRISVYLLGSNAEVVEKAAMNISHDYPEINISGFHHGFYSTQDEIKIVEEINNSGAEILIIGMGFPIQEQFVLKHRTNLHVPLIWNVGGLFDLISGYKPRAPRIMRSMRLEWLFRFLLEPGRMLHRNTICAAWSLMRIIFNKNIVKQ